MQGFSINRVGLLRLAKFGDSQPKPETPIESTVSSLRVRAWFLESGFENQSLLVRLLHLAQFEDSHPKPYF